MRSFNLGAILFDENFEGYRTAAELLETWPQTGSGATVTLGSDPYSSGGQRQCAVLTFAGATSAAGIRTAQWRYDGVYIPNEATLQVGYTLGYKYRASPELDGMTLRVEYSHSFFGGNVTVAAVCDGEWHVVSGAITDFPESVGASGLQVTAQSVPAAGVLAIDDIVITRTSPLARVIDNTCPVCAFRWNGEGGFRETLRYKTQVLTARDGSETREQLRLFHRSRIEYEIRSENAQQTARIDAWLWQNHGKRVAVPRWVDALYFGEVIESGTWIWLAGGTTDDRMLEPYQRFMLWDSATSYEALQLWQVGTNYLRLDVDVNAVTGSWTPNVTKVVPLVPARLDAELALNRPNPALGIIPLAFDVEVAT